MNKWRNQFKKVTIITLAVMLAGVIMDMSAYTVHATQNPSITGIEELNVVDEGDCGENLTWKVTLNEDGTTYTLTISGSGEMAYEGYDAPWYNDSKYYESINKVSLPEGLTSIEQYAFYEFEALTSIDIPYGVETIGEGAFQRCYSLTSVTIPDSVITIERITFWSCHNLTSVILSNNLSAISELMLGDCPKLTSITIPDGVESIGRKAFEGCSSLTEATIPNSVTTIGNNAFSGCRSLIKMSIPSSVTSIGVAAFSRCNSITAFEVTSNNPAYTSVDGVLFTKDEMTLVAFPAAKSSSYTIPDGVTTIGNGAFSYGEITDIDIPNSVTVISDEAFYSCKKLTNIEISVNVTSIGGSAFYACESRYGGAVERCS